MGRRREYIIIYVNINITCKRAGYSIGFCGSPEFSLNSFNGIPSIAIRIVQYLRKLEMNVNKSLFTPKAINSDISTLFEMLLKFLELKSYSHQNAR